jgi:integrase
MWGQGTQPPILLRLLDTWPINRLATCLRTLTGQDHLAILLGCGLRRRELSDLTMESIQKREERWAIVDLVGKGRHIRTVPVPAWVKDTLDAWLAAAGIERGPLFRCVCRADKLWGDRISEKTVWHVVKKVAASLKMPQVSPHDLRRSCARLCHASGGELEQIQFLLGHVSVQTTERYIGCKQRFRGAVNDKLGIEPGSVQPAPIGA